jgi:SAM-dependent methyltransferase
MNCRHCRMQLGRTPADTFLDLGAAPASNAFLREADLLRAEAHFPLKVFACPSCALVQVDEVQRHDLLFSDDYVYFSSYSSSWLEHARRYVDEAVERLALGPSSQVLEVASNDGYLLQYVRDRGIRCVGVEPTAGTARAARERGIDTVEVFFGRESARALVSERGRFDLAIANNVLAHVPDIDDFVAGFAEALAPNGSVSFEFPHLLELVRSNQFDTVYHEHFSYLSLRAVERILSTHGLAVWDVETLPTHGGSLRVWAAPTASRREALASVARMRSHESDAGIGTPAFHAGVQAAAERVKDDLLTFLITHKRAGRRVVGYGAAAKGNTLLNFAGVRPDLLAFVADASPHKQGRFLPGSRIPVLAPEALRQARPDVVLVLPWNLREEIIKQLAFVRDWGGRFAVAVPALQEF